MEEKESLNLFFNFCVAFVVGITTAAFFSLKLCYISLGIFFVAFLVGLILKKKIKIKHFWACCLFSFFGAFWFCFNVVFSYNFASSFEGTKKEVVCTFKDIEFYEDGGKNYIFKVKEIGDEKPLIPFNIRIFSPRESYLDLEYFDEIRAVFKLKPTLKKGWFNFFDGNLSKSLFLNGELASDIEVVNEGRFAAGFLNFRDSLSDNVDLFVDRPYNFFAKGLIFGNKKGMPYRFRRIINRCGLSHIFAVSGLHISILAVLIILVLKFFRVPGSFSFVILFLFLFCYAFIVGFSASVLRACFMAFFVCLGMLFEKKLKSIYSLFFAAASILLIWPMSIFGLSFLLSFFSCGGIILLQRKISKFILNIFKSSNGLLEFFVEGFSVSVAAMLPTSFISILVFKKIPVLAPITNLLVMPFLPILFIASIFVALLGALSQNIAAYLGYFCEGLFGVILSFLEFVSKCPFCYISLNYLFAKIVAFLMLIFIFIYFLILKQNRVDKKFIISSALILGIPFIFNFALTKDKIKIYALSRNFGSSVIIKGQDKVVVVECGGGGLKGREIVDFLESKGINKVDVFLVASNGRNNLSDSLDFVDVFKINCIFGSKKARNSSFFDHIDLEKNNVVRGKHFNLEFFPATMTVLDDNDDFGFYLNLNGICIAYSRRLKFMKYMAKKRHVHLAIVDRIGRVKDKEKILDDLKKSNVLNCLELKKKGSFDDFVKVLGEKGFLELTLDGYQLKEGEF